MCTIWGAISSQHQDHCRSDNVTMIRMHFRCHEKFRFSVAIQFNWAIRMSVDISFSRGTIRFHYQGAKWFPRVHLKHGFSTNGNSSIYYVYTYVVLLHKCLSQNDDEEDAFAVIGNDNRMFLLKSCVNWYAGHPIMYVKFWQSNLN